MLYQECKTCGEVYRVDGPYDEVGLCRRCEDDRERLEFERAESEKECRQTASDAV